MLGLLQDVLRPAGYHTEVAATLDAAHRRLSRERFPVVILSLGPEFDPLRSLLHDHGSALIGLLPSNCPRSPDAEVPKVLAAPYRLSTLFDLLERKTGREAGPQQFALFDRPTP